MKVRLCPAFVPALFFRAAAVWCLLAVGTAAQAQSTPRMGTAAITRTATRDAGVVLTHLQQQLVRVTGVSTPSAMDVETLGRALDAARVRQVTPEHMKALSESLAAALGSGTFEEVTLQRLAEDLFAVLNNRALTRDQASLAALDVGAALLDLGVQEPRIALVQTALEGVCPAAVARPTTVDDAGQAQPKAPTKRSLLTLSRDSSN
jgi:hypothetical protein